MNRTRLYDRVIRREVHRSRATAAMVVVLVLVVVVAWFGAETVLHLLGRAPLLISPADLAAQVADVAAVPRESLLLAGCLGILAGLLLLLLGLLPGRRGRHGRATGRVAVVVDDRVVAASIATAAARAAGTMRDQVRVSVGRRSAEVFVTPSSGVPVIGSRVREAVDEELAGYDLRPRLRAAVKIGDRGTVGA